MIKVHDAFFIEAALTYIGVMLTFIFIILERRL